MIAAEISRVASDADERGENVELAIFRAAASAALLDAAYVLAVAVNADEDDLVDVVNSTWSDTANVTANSQIIEELTRWPFVRRAVDGLTISGSIGEALARSFQSTDPAKFRTVHQAFADRES